MGSFAFSFPVLSLWNSVCVYTYGTSQFCLAILCLMASGYHIGHGRLQLFFSMVIVRGKLGYIPSAMPLENFRAVPS